MKGIVDSYMNLDVEAVSMDHSTDTAVGNGMDLEESENESARLAANTLGPYYEGKKKIKAIKSLS